MIGLGLSIVQLAVRQLLGGAFSPAILFGTSDQGVWYDPSDYSTLFQDSAGTTPVTALEQPVGRMLDKSGKGNHATQPTATSRPVVSARVNLLTKTEQFDDGVWAKSNVTSTASKVTPNTSNYFHSTSQPVTYAATGFTSVIEAKADGYQYLQILLIAGSSYVEGVFNLSGLGAVENTSRNVGWIGTRSIEMLSDGYYRCTVTVNTASAASGVYQVGVFPTNDSNTAFAGNGTSGILVRKADLRVANDGVGIPAYQRVNTATDYDSTGFPVYLRADGVDDGMVTNSIDFTATDKMTVVAGVRKLSEVGAAIIELTSSSLTDGAFSVFAGDGGTPNRRFAWSTSTPQAFIGSGQLLAPSTVVDTVAFDRSGTTTNTQIFPRLNGSPATLSEVVGANTTGNFAGAPLYLFRRAGTGTAFNGRFYGMTIVNKLLSTAELTQLETYTNGKTKAFA
jgi:hypothetical protein